MVNKDRSQFAIIGLGRFGQALALKLYGMHKDVLAVDVNEDKVNAITDLVTHSITADATEESVLKAIGIKNFDVVVVCIGNNMQASILATLICKQLGVKFVVAKAQSEKHKNVLEKIGADMVIFPEEYMGKKLASMLVNPNINDVIDLSDTCKLAEIKTPKKWAGKSLKEIDLRKNDNISVMYVKHENGEIAIAPGGDCVLNLGDSVMLCGENNVIDKISNKLCDE